MRKCHTSRAAIHGASAHYDSGPFLSWPDKWSDVVTRLQRQLLSADSGRFEQTRDVPNIPAQGYIPIPPPEPQDFQAQGCCRRWWLLNNSCSPAAREHCCGYQRAHVRRSRLNASSGLLPGLVALLRKHDILWIDDEVLCGMGRLGEWFGYQLSPDISPDIMVVGKGINGSSLPSGGFV